MYSTLITDKHFCFQSSLRTSVVYLLHTVNLFTQDVADPKEFCYPLASWVRGAEKAKQERGWVVSKAVLCHRSNVTVTDPHSGVCVSSASPGGNSQSCSSGFTCKVSFSHGIPGRWAVRSEESSVRTCQVLMQLCPRHQWELCSKLADWLALGTGTNQFQKPLLMMQHMSQ